MHKFQLASYFVLPMKAARFFSVSYSDHHFIVTLSDSDYSIMAVGYGCVVLRLSKWHLQDAH